MSDHRRSGKRWLLAIATLAFVGSERTLPVLRAVAERGGPEPELARASLRWLSLRGVRSPILGERRPSHETPE